MYVGVYFGFIYFYHCLSVISFLSVHVYHVRNSNHVFVINANFKHKFFDCYDFF
jgi:hypothetical protein